MKLYLRTRAVLYPMSFAIFDPVGTISGTYNRSPSGNKTAAEFYLTKIIRILTLLSSIMLYQLLYISIILSKSSVIFHYWKGVGVCNGVILSSFSQSTALCSWANNLVNPAGHNLKVYFTFSFLIVS